MQARTQKGRVAEMMYCWVQYDEEYGDYEYLPWMTTQSGLNSRIDGVEMEVLHGTN